MFEQLLHHATPPPYRWSESGNNFDSQRKKETTKGLSMVLVELWDKQVLTTSILLHGKKIVSELEGNTNTIVNMARSNILKPVFAVATKFINNLFEIDFLTMEHISEMLFEDHPLLMV